MDLTVRELRKMSSIKHNEEYVLKVQGAVSQRGVLLTQRFNGVREKKENRSRQFPLVMLQTYAWPPTELMSQRHKATQEEDVLTLLLSSSQGRKG